MSAAPIPAQPGSNPPTHVQQAQFTSTLHAVPPPPAAPPIRNGQVPSGYTDPASQPQIQRSNDVLPAQVASAPASSNPHAVHHAHPNPAHYQSQPAVSVPQNIAPSINNIPNGTASYPSVVPVQSGYLSPPTSAAHSSLVPPNTAQPVEYQATGYSTPAPQAAQTAVALQDDPTPQTVTAQATNPSTPFQPTQPNGQLIGPSNSNNSDSAGIANGSAEAEEKKDNVTRRREILDEAISKRFTRLPGGVSRLTKTPKMTADETGYNIWCPPDAEPIDRAILRTEDCRKMRVLLDTDGILGDVHLDALRFLWGCLIADPCSGGVFNHGMGYPRQHLVYIFAHVLSKLYSHRKKTILVICQNSSLNQWQLSMRSFPHSDLKVTTVEQNDWLNIVKKWKVNGGILLCAVQDYEGISMCYEQERERSEAMRALCSPGPDVIIVDEVTRLGSINPVSRAFLSRTGTKARLGLTSTPISGDLLRTWSAVDWACPKYLGSEREFWKNWVSLILDGHENEAKPELGEVAMRKAILLYRKLRKVTYVIGSNERRAALRKRPAAVIHDSTVTVSLSSLEADVYNRTASIVSDAVKDGKGSIFIAHYILSVAATSVRALRVLLNGAKELSSNESQEAFPGMEDHIGDAGKLMLSIKEQLGDQLDEAVPSTKLELAKALTCSCVESNERLVIFVCSREVHNEIVGELKNFDSIGSSSPDNVVFSFTIKDSEEKRIHEVNSFNKAQGAVIVAPFGPGPQCMEDAGWGFVNASRVLVLDSNWYFTSSSQALNRVHNFAQRRAVIVHHALSMGTIDNRHELSTDMRFASMKKAYSKAQQKSSWTEIFQNVQYRGYLIEPELCLNHVEGHVQPSTKPNNPSIDLHDVEDDATKQLLTNALEVFTKFQCDDDRFPVHTVTLRSSRYKRFAETLEFFPSSNLPIESLRTGDDQREQLVLERADVCSDVLKTIDIVNDSRMVQKDFDGSWTVQVQAMERGHDLLHLWGPYYRLYDTHLNPGQNRKLPPPSIQRRAEENSQSKSRSNSRRSADRSDHRVGQESLRSGERQANRDPRDRPHHDPSLRSPPYRGEGPHERMRSRSRSPSRQRRRSLSPIRMPRAGPPRRGSPHRGHPRGMSPRGRSSRGHSPRGRSPRGRSPRGRDPRSRSPRGQSPRGRDPRDWSPRDRRQGSPAPNREYGGMKRGRPPFEGRGHGGGSPEHRRRRMGEEPSFDGGPGRGRGRGRSTVLPHWKMRS